MEDEKACDDGNNIENFWCEYLGKESVASVKDAEEKGERKELSKSPTDEL